MAPATVDWELFLEASWANVNLDKLLVLLEGVPRTIDVRGTLVFIFAFLRPKSSLLSYFQRS